VPALLRRTKADTMAGRYGIMWPLKDNHFEGNRIYADFYQVGAEPGRMSCSRPNLQNIPRDKAYRACIGPARGRVLVSADYSQIEMRIAAVLSGDEALLAAFRAGEDIHTATAERALGAHPAMSKEERTYLRQLAKTLNFGLLYGAGALTFRESAVASGVSLTLEEAEQFRNRFFSAYRGLQRWQAVQGNSTGPVRTLAGRRRLRVPSYTQRLNTPVQGTAADLLKLALARIWEDRHAHPTAALVNIVHDEILIECDAGEAEAVKVWLKDHMEAVGPELVPDVPIVAEAQVIPWWGWKPPEDEQKQ
jgi:DNA polymerase-1